MPQRPTRPVAHARGDLGADAAEQCAHRCGYAAEKIRSDYGLDVLITTVDAAEQVENGAIHVQARATSRLRRNRDDTISISISTRHLRHWRNEPYPVILVVYDVTNQRGFWLYIQRHFQGMTISPDRKSMTLRVPLANELTDDAMRQFRLFKEHVQQQILDAQIHHG